MPSRSWPSHGRAWALLALGSLGACGTQGAAPGDAPAPSRAGARNAAGGVSTGTGGDGTGGMGAAGAAATGDAGSGAAGAAHGAAASDGAGAGGARAGSAGSSAGVSGSSSRAGSGGATESAGQSGAGGASAMAGTASGSSGAGGNATCNAGSGPVVPTELAFPEAQGFGRHATGGRDGTVVHVTNLNDAGAGSFRDAVSQPNRIVVFDVGGYVALETAVSVKSNITVAGQTAPGGGIGFRGGEISFANSSNIVLRHVRIRPGSDTESDEDDALSLYRARNVIVEHCSFEFGPWNNIDGVSDDWRAHPVADITFQDSLIANPTGQQFGAHTESVSSDWSWYRNAFANSHNRNPLAKVNNVFVNNVLYNDSAGYTTHTSTSFEHDVVNNAFVFGPASTGTDNTWYQIDENQSIYAAGNVKDADLDGTLGGAATTPYWYQGTGTVLASAWSSVATTRYSARDAYRIAVSQAGALPRDPVDALVVSQMQTLGKGATGTGANTSGPDGGLYTSQAQTGLGNEGYGEITGGMRAPDADEDGMPDFWEAATGSDPGVNDAMQRAPDGYALVERYLNWLAEPHAVTHGGASVDIDLAALTLGFRDVAPTFTVTEPACGAVTLTGMHVARYVPPTGFTGVTAFEFTVKGSDGTTYATRVGVVVGP